MRHVDCGFCVLLTYCPESTQPCSALEITPLPTLKAEPGQPIKETHFGLLYSWPYSFGHYPGLIIIGKGWICRLTCKVQLSLNHGSPVQRLYFCSNHTNLLVHLSIRLPFTHEQHSPPLHKRLMKQTNKISG